MDIQEEMKAFERHLTDTGLVEFAGYGFELNECDEYLHEPTLVAWECWLIGSRRAKAQAVPEWISTSERMPEEGEEVFVHNHGQVRQATRDSSWAGGFKERNCYGWQATYSQSHWMPKSIKLPEQYHFYYEFDVLMNDSKQKSVIKAQEPAND